MLASELLPPITEDKDSLTRHPNPKMLPTLTFSVTSSQFSIPSVLQRFFWLQKILELGQHIYFRFYIQRGSWELSLGSATLSSKAFCVPQELSRRLLHVEMAGKLELIWLSAVITINVIAILFCPCREPGRAEADFGRLDAKTVVGNIYILFSRSEIPIASENQEIMDLVEPSIPLPPSFTEEDLAAYGALYEKFGFQTALKVPSGQLMKSFNLSDPTVKVPAFLRMGGKDYFLKFPGVEDFIKSGKVEEFTPNLEITFIPEGTHVVQEQFPEQVNQLILGLLGKHF